MARLLTAAGEKINADKHISYLADAGPDAGGYAKIYP
jgi:hypothetical protein